MPCGYYDVYYVTDTYNVHESFPRIKTRIKVHVQMTQSCMHVYIGNSDTFNSV